MNLLVLLIIITVFFTLSKPWIGVNAYYLLAILGPQYIWWWYFEDFRVSLIIASSSALSVLLHLSRKDYYDSRFVFNRQNLVLLCLWGTIVISYLFGPYVPLHEFAGLSPSQIFSITNSMFLFYFIASLELNKIYKLRWLVIIFSLSTAYMIYWANSQYFLQNWAQFNLGRLMGPSSIDGGAVYRDENVFSVLFVTGLPFIYYLGWQVKQAWFRYSLWLFIPLGWHAVFLTGSRGGLVGICVTITVAMLLSRRKALIIPLFVVFLLFYQWQAGDVMHDRSSQIVNIEGESSANDRLTAWRGGLNMVLNYPFTGVGLGSFVTALPDYIESRNMVAHNTFVQFTAESGIGAGMSYICLIVLFYLHSGKIHSWCRNSNKTKEIRAIDLYNRANTSSFSGLLVCSFFLSLTIFEIFFVLLVLNNSMYQVCLKYDHNGEEDNY